MNKSIMANMPKIFFVMVLPPEAQNA